MLKSLALLLLLLAAACGAPESPDNSREPVGGSAGSTSFTAAGSPAEAGAEPVLVAGSASEGGSPADSIVAAGAAGDPEQAGAPSIVVAEGGAAGAPVVESGGSAGAVEVSGGAAGETSGPMPGSQWTHCDTAPGGDACSDPLLCGQYIVHFGDSGTNHICTFTCRGADAGETSTLMAKCAAIGGVCYGDGNQNAMCVPSVPTLAP